VTRSSPAPGGGARARSSLWSIVLAGGKGERFWPLSREHRPKPLVDLGSGRSLLRETILRARQLSPASRIRVIAGALLAPVIRRDLGRLGRGGVIVEAAARNTGPAALLASRWVWERDRQGTLLVLPSDHRVVGREAFRLAVEKARKLAARGYLVTFGIRPSGPVPDYGYILKGAPIGALGHRVRRFVEKPPEAEARRLLRRGGALWNSGMFVWSAKVFLEEASRCEPAFARWLAHCKRGGSMGGEARKAFMRLPFVPVDRAVLERSDRVAVVESSFAWSDLGAWAALYDLGRKDARGNVGWGEIAAIDSSGNLAFSSDGIVVLCGVTEFLVARVNDVVLVCPRGRAMQMRDILASLRKGGHGGYL
jgi:mannose-1-phosphate guanylyltransferase / mannose-6-phosphate isomerase